MALEITEGAEAKLTLTGTSTELPSVYARIGCVMPDNGLTIKARMFNYQEKALYLAGETSANIEEIQAKYDLEVDVASGETQTIQLAHEKMKAILEAEGYTVQIIDLPA